MVVEFEAVDYREGELSVIAGNGVDTMNFPVVFFCVCTPLTEIKVRDTGIEADRASVHEGIEALLIQLRGAIGTDDGVSEGFTSADGA